MTMPLSPEWKVLQRWGIASVTAAVVIGLTSLTARTLGIDHGAFILVGSLGVLLFGASVLFLARSPWRATVGSRVRVLLWLALIAAISLLLLPAVYTAGMAYGGSWLEWDPVHRTHYYAERPGGFAVIVVALVLCTALAMTAATSVALAIRTGGPSLRSARAERARTR